MRSRFLRDMSVQALGGYLSTAFQVVRGVALAALLGPDGLGTVSIIGVLLSYSQYADLGVAQAVSRELPVAIGRGKPDEAAAWSWYAHVIKLAASATLSVCVLAFTALRWSTLDDGLRFGLLTASVVIVLQGSCMVAQMLFQARQQFARSTAVLVAVWATNLVAGVAGALLAGLKGVFVGQIIAFAVATILAVAIGGGARRVRLHMSRVRQLVRIGLPLAALLFAGYNLINIDQIMVAVLLGREQLGVYVLALYAGTALYLLPTAMAGVASPRLLRKYGEEATVTSITALTWRPVHVLSAVMPILVAATWIVAPAVIVRYLSDYAAAIAPLRVYAAAIFFLGLNLGVSSTLLALNKHRYNIPVLVACIGLNVAVDLLLVGVLGYGLTAIAVGSLITYLVYWVAHTALVRHWFDQRLTQALRRNLSCGWPGFVLIAFLVAASSLGVLDDSRPLLEAVPLAVFCVVGVLRLRHVERLAASRAWHDV